ncbi:DUF4893 domain-containing protein [Sphingomonas lenta]|uniref:DUF4893 domain-containing protein n=1 Tax=Sphingomonas lenta TaxID=1141887 RepID=A0A2A2SHY5_9SPHN|nr:DUF4893 domain-containing protein [Sphingomonas lenta]
MSLLFGIIALVAPAADWRDLATEDDRRRLRSWRDAWMAALPRARRGGGAAVIAAEGPLFNPDRNLRGPTPPAGDYRCRTFKLGSQGPAGLDFIAYSWFRCRVGADGAFAKVDGSQRPVGAIHAHTSGRAVFLGTLSLGDERRVIRYGRDRNRDMAAFVERVGDRRWRMVFPYPRFESLLDVIELVPVSVGTTGGGTTAGAGATAGAGSGGSETR